MTIPESVPEKEWDRNAERWVTWVDPYGKLSRPCHSFMRANDAAAEYMAAHPERPYNEHTALEDFMVVNWASFCDPPPAMKERTR